jgi:anaerobic magnesium-protoporphyrin IX monomethyl ester cyclase
MNVLFIASDHNIKNKSEHSLDYCSMLFGISYISSVLKANSHNTKLLYLYNDGDNNKIIDYYIESFAPKLVCFNFVATEFNFIANIAQRLKENYPEIFLLAGGPHASLCPEECILEAFGALCIGEGEEPTLELVHQLEKGLAPSGIQNLWIKHDSMIEKSSSRPFICIDKLPFPDRDMWREWVSTPISKMAILLGRGCPFLCSHCCNHALRKICPGVYVRLRPLDSIMDEINEIKNNFPLVNEIYFEIETFGIDVNWSMKLCKRLKEFNTKLDKPISFGVNLRIMSNIKSDILFKSMREANFNYINIGLESGSERVRRNILRRNESNEDIIKTVQLAKSYGLKINIYNMMGIPGEEYGDFLQTIALNRICLPDQSRTAICFPYPGSDLFEQSKKSGLIGKKLDHDMEREKATLDLPGFSKKKIQNSYVWFEYYIYKGHKPTHKLLLGVLDRKMRVTFPSDRLYMLTIYNFLKKLKASII